MQDLEFNEIIDLIHKDDSRFDRRAYHFVRAGLDATVKELKKREPDRARKSQHVSGAELLHGLRTYALEQFGPLAYTVNGQMRHCDTPGGAGCQGRGAGGGRTRALA